MAGAADYAIRVGDTFPDGTHAGCTGVADEMAPMTFAKMFSLSSRAPDLPTLDESIVTATDRRHV
jgi:hypothetical protein